MTNNTHKVEKLVHGGMGIVRDEARAVFVPYVIPGEDVWIQIDRESKKPIIGIARDIVTPSPDRIEPRCPLFGECGGCQFQHISYPAQLRFKAEILAESLAWIAKIKPDIDPFIPSPSEYHYRSRIRMHIRRGVAGFFAWRKKALVPVPYCFISHEDLNRAIPGLPYIMERERPDTIEIIRMKDHIVAESLSHHGKATYRIGLSKGELSGEWEPWKGKVAFQQVNIEQNEVLRTIVAKAVSGISPKRVIELYAGSGNLTEVILPNAGKVDAVDFDHEAVALARERFSTEIGGKLEFAQMGAGQYIENTCREDLKPDLIVLDPPRTGAKDAIDGILRLMPGNIIYVSCDPATLARDLKPLIGAGYQIKSITPIDMFPQTSHIEAVAILSK